MSKTQEALKLALEALEESLGYVEEEAENAQRLYGKYPTRQARIQGLKDDVRKHWDAIEAGRRALAAAEQHKQQPADEPVAEPHKWVGLTNGEIQQYVESRPYYGHCNPEYREGIDEGARWADAKLREKNT